MKRLRICLIGYGRMGKAIEQLAMQRGHNVFLIIDNEQDWLNNISDFLSADVAIDFSVPSKVMDNIHKCFDGNVPVVVGTTGWYNQLEEVESWCLQTNQSLFYAPNFSLGMNIVFEMNRMLAGLVTKGQYKITISETHHLNKKDAPSGTAIQLAKDIIQVNTQYKGWKIGNQKETDLLPIEVTRRDNVSGIHEITAVSNEDTITLRHEAGGLDGFALGSVLAAEFLYGKKGVFTVKDLLRNALQ